MSREKRPRKWVLQPRLPGAHPTLEEKAKYVDLFSREFAEGHTVKAIAAKYGLSTASIYRWWRQQDDVQRSLNARHVANHLQIEKSIETLCNSSQANPASTRDALFHLLVWIRWPHEPGLHLPALISCTTNYLRQKHRVDAIGDLDEVERLTLFRYLTLDSIARFTAPQGTLNPDFEITTTGVGRLDDRQFYAKVVNYLLSGNNSASRRSYNPTLSSLQNLIEEGAFDRKWLMSSRTFEKHWRSRAKTFPFLYVEQYHSNLDWSLDPQDDFFVQDVDERLQDGQELLSYFGKVKWVIQRLCLILDKRAVAHIEFPKLPAWLEAIPVRNPALDYQLDAKLKQSL